MTLPRMWCPKCAEWTVLIDTGRCPWCSTSLAAKPGAEPAREPVSCRGCGKPLTLRVYHGGQEQKWCSERCRRSVRGMTPMLDIEPFRAWLRALEAEHGARRTADLVGVSERQVYRWLKKGTRVKLATVENALEAEGGTQVFELYPWMNDMLEVA